jgi:hypothetical protein
VRSCTWSSGRRALPSQLRYALKTPYRGGTTHIVLEPLDLDGEAGHPGAAAAEAPEVGETDSIVSLRKKGVAF